MKLSNIGKVIAYFFSIPCLNSHYLLSANMSDCLRDITDNTDPKDSTKGTQEEGANVR